MRGYQITEIGAYLSVASCVSSPKRETQNAPDPRLIGASLCLVAPGLAEPPRPTHKLGATANMVGGAQGRSAPLRVMGCPWSLRATRGVRGVKVGPRSEP